VIEETFQRWRPRLVRFCAQLLANGHDAEEVVQDVFVRLVAAEGRYELGEDAGVLLFRLARNRCVDVQRRAGAGAGAAAVGEVDAAAPVDGARFELEDALASLPAAEREALLLTAVDGLGYRDVAAILNCSLGSVAALRCAAIEKLRRRWTP